MRKCRTGMCVVLGLLAGLCLLAAPAQADLILNGSFETGPSFIGGFTTLSSGNTSIAGWTVGSGSVDYIGSYWQAADGGRSIDLAGNGPGSISQTFETVAGQSYTVSFYMAGNPDGGTSLKALAASAGSVTEQVFTFSTVGNTKSDMGWTRQSFNFVAAGDISTLTFASDITGPYGPAIDKVSVPEPGTLLLLGAGLLGLAGARKKFRK